MIITSQVIATAEVDVFQLDRPGIFDAIASKLESAVITEGANVGAFIRRGFGSVRFHRGPMKAATMVQVMYGVWSPDPALGVEFRGGSHDGEVKPLRREADGMPPAHVVLSAPMASPSFGLSDFEQVLGFPVDSSPRDPRYRRAGKNGESDRWVYVLDA